MEISSTKLPSDARRLANNLVATKSELHRTRTSGRKPEPGLIPETLDDLYGSTIDSRLDADIRDYQGTMNRLLQEQQGGEDASLTSNEVIGRFKKHSKKLGIITALTGVGGALGLLGAAIALPEVEKLGSMLPFFGVLAGGVVSAGAVRVAFSAGNVAADISMSADRLEEWQTHFNEG